MVKFYHDKITESERKDEAYIYSTIFYDYAKTTSIYIYTDDVDMSRINCAYLILYKVNNIVVVNKTYKVELYKCQNIKVNAYELRSFNSTFEIERVFSLRLFNTYDFVVKGCVQQVYISKCRNIEFAKKHISRATINSSSDIKLTATKIFLDDCKDFNIGNLVCNEIRIDMCKNIFSNVKFKCVKLQAIFCDEFNVENIYGMCVGFVTAIDVDISDFKNFKSVEVGCKNCYATSNVKFDKLVVRAVDVNLGDFVTSNFVRIFCKNFDNKKSYQSCKFNEKTDLFKFNVLEVRKKSCSFI
jgi:hypothetical protein